MKVKLLLFGEGVAIPKTGLNIGVGLLSLWMDNNGFTSASNQIGTLGYIFLETPEIDIGSLDDERQQIFANLHGRTITFDLKPTLFVRDGGICRVAMTATVQSGGSMAEKKIEFLAQNCKGLSIVAGPLSFTCEMLQLEKRLADFTTEQIIAEEDIVAIADAAPGEQPEGVNA